MQLDRFDGRNIDVRLCLPSPVAYAMLKTLWNESWAFGLSEKTHSRGASLLSSQEKPMATHMFPSFSSVLLAMPANHS